MRAAAVTHWIWDAEVTFEGLRSTEECKERHQDSRGRILIITYQEKLREKLQGGLSRLARLVFHPKKSHLCPPSARTGMQGGLSRFAIYLLHPVCLCVFV